MALHAPGRVRRHLAEPLMTSAVSLMANTVVVSLLGVIFWITAARLFPSAEVGQDSALISTIIALAGICNLNMVNAVPRFLPQVRDPARVLATAYLATAIVALLAATGFVLIAPQLVSKLGVLTSKPLLGVGFVASTVVWCVFSAQDAALASMRRSVWVPIENGVYAVLKLAALPVLAAVGIGNGVFQAWVLPLVLVVVPVNVFLFRVVFPHHRRTRAETVSPLRGGRRRLIGFMAMDYGATTFAAICWTGLPMLAFVLIGSSASAYFYVAFIIVQALEFLATGAGVSVVVESAFAEERLKRHARVMVARLLPLVLTGAAVVIVAAPLILSVFGNGYRAGGTPLLRLLGVSVGFRCVIVLFRVVQRSRRRGGLLLLVDGVTTTLVLGLSTALAPGHGLTGIGIAWLIGNGAIALAVLPGLVSFLRVVPEDKPVARRVGLRLAAGSGSGAFLGISALSVAACVAALALIGLDAAPVPSALALVAVFCLGPGVAILPFIGRRDAPWGLGAVLGVSLAVSIVIAEVMLELSVWEPRGTALALAGVCLPFAVLHAARTGAALMASRQDA